MEKTHTIQITDKQAKLLEHFIEQLDNELANAGCNDLPAELLNLFTEEEGRQVAREFAYMNNPTFPDGPDWPISDNCLLYWLQRKILDQVKP